MKEYVKVKELLEEVDEMAKRGTLLARGEVTQEELAMQIRGFIIHVAMKDTKNKKSFNEMKKEKETDNTSKIINIFREGLNK